MGKEQTSTLMRKYTMSILSGYFGSPTIQKSKSCTTALGTLKYLGKVVMGILDKQSPSESPVVGIVGEMS
jgi:hypothetical protein